MKYYATLQHLDLGAICIGTSDGKGDPRFTFEAQAKGLEGPYGDRLSEFYERGAHETGAIGEVREMVMALERLADTDDDLSVEIPRETAKKIADEITAEAERLPKGAQF